MTSDDQVARFAGRLRQARNDAGLTLRELAATSGYSPSTLSVAESGERLPSWQVTEAFVQACREPDISRWRGWWDAAAEARVLGEPDSSAALSPAEVATSAPPAPVVTPTGQRRSTVRWWYMPVATLLTVALTLFAAVPIVRWQLTASPPQPGGRDPMPTHNCGEGIPGHGCHGKDQNATGCYADARLVARNDEWGWDGAVSLARLETWYSDNCGTSWAAMNVKTDWEMRLEISSRDTRTCHPADCESFSSVSSPTWTPMVFAANQPTRVRGAVRRPDGAIYLMEAWSD